MSNPIFEQQPGLVESSFVAKVYSKTNQTSAEIIGALFDEMDSSYGDLDTFIRDAGDDIEALFDELDQQFCEFLNERHIYQYDEDDLSAYTRNSSPAWQQVMAAVINMRDEIDGKEADERAYRSARKDGRGRVVGGGFGFSGAVKGMAAAGAINMTTGIFHGIANAVGNAASAAEASRKKRILFRDKEMRQALRNSLWVDCENMLAGFIAFWNQLGIGQIPWYSSDNLRQAENIQCAIERGQVPANQLEQATIRMLRTYPLNLSLYDTAARFLPEREADIFAAAAEYGIDMYTRKRQFEQIAQNCAKRLAESDVFSQYHDCLGYSLEDAVACVSSVYRNKFNSSFATLTAENRSSYKRQIQTLRSTFASGSETEEVLCFMAEPQCSSADGILLTDNHLYYCGSYPAQTQGRLLCETLSQIETICLNGENYIQLNGDVAVKIPQGVEAWVVLDVIKFLASYCGFLTYASFTGNETLTDAVLRYTGISEDQLEIGVEFSEEYSTPSEISSSSDTVFCFNCGAKNEAGSKFCMDCGAEL